MTEKVTETMTEHLWAQGLLRQIYEKELVVAARSRGKLPYTTVEGRFDDWTDRPWWWTNGFYGGLMWRLYQLFETEKGEESLLRQTAESVENALDADLMEYQWMDHDNGFKWLLTSVANYKMTGRRPSKNRALLAAGQLAGRFNLKASLIRAWNDECTGEVAGLAIIDCMMNLPLLYWASRETKDPRFEQIAMAHADKAIEAFVRENGSVNHIVVFDPKTGALLGSRGGQGMQEGSSWTRGQSWALYGFTQSYLYTGEERYLLTACRVADYIESRLSEREHMPVDYDQPLDIPWEDSTAAAITACGFLELARALEKVSKRAEAYRAAGCKLLHTLANDRLELSSDTDHLLTHCTAAYHDENHDFAIIYGDYYFTEALSKL